MKRAIAASLVALVLLVAVGFLVTRAEAETVKYKVITYITKMEMLPVPDVENHFIALLKGEALPSLKMAKQQPSAAGLHGTISADKEAPLEGTAL